MTPSERRSEILHLLCKRRHETAINLSAELGVSERTIRADLVILSCYYPIQVVRGRFGGGIHLPDWFHMESRTLSSKQQVLLMKVRKTLSGDDLQVMNSILAQFARIGSIGDLPISVLILANRISGSGIRPLMRAPL